MKTVFKNPKLQKLYEALVDLFSEENVGWVLMDDDDEEEEEAIQLSINIKNDCQDSNFQHPYLLWITADEIPYLFGYLEKKDEDFISFNFEKQYLTNSTKYVIIKTQQKKGNDKNA